MKVEMLGDEKTRASEGFTVWLCTHGTRSVRIRHNHTTLKHPVFHITRFGRTGVPTGDNAIVTARDFGDVLTVVRDMLGVRS